MDIPTIIDMVQCEKKLQTPEIRVWCHPKDGGDDFYEVFDTFQQAEDFIPEHQEAEALPLIAFRGREINLYAIDATVVAPEGVKEEEAKVVEETHKAEEEKPEE